MSIYIGEVIMKMLIVAAISSMLFVSNVYAGYPKDTLHVERVFIMQNGTGSGKNISSTTFVKRNWTESDCSAAAVTYNAQTYVAGGGNSVPVITIARCEALNPSIFQ